MIDPLPELDSLKDKIDRATREKDPHTTPKAKEKAARSRTAALAFRMGVDLVAAIGVSIAIGIFLDDQFNSAPLFFILLFCLGSVAGFRMMMQTNAQAQRMQAKADAYAKEDNAA